MRPLGTGHRQDSAHASHRENQRKNRERKLQARNAGPQPAPVAAHPFEPYGMRHTALTRMAPHCDPFTLARIAGHSSITITQRYCHPGGRRGSSILEIRLRGEVVTEAGHHSKEESQEQSEQQPVIDSNDRQELARPERFELPTY